MQHFSKVRIRIKKSLIREGLGCDDGANGVNLGAGLEIAISEGVWHVDCMFSQSAKHMNPNRPIAESRGV